MRLVQKALTFDDVLLVPAYSAVLPRDVSLRTRLTRSIDLNIPLVSAAMDTVTEARGDRDGTGRRHRHRPQEPEAGRPGREVARVKRYESGVLRDPITISPDMKIRDVIALSHQHGISGFPVLEGKTVVGIITNRDLRFEEELDAPVRAKMTPREKLVTVAEGASTEEAKRLMNRHRTERVLVVNTAFELRGLITVKDIQKAVEHPLASKDDHGQLRVGAAVGVGPDNDERVELLVKAGVDVIVVDTAHGHSRGVLDRVRWVKQNFPQVQVIGGNIATGEAARALVEHGADGVKVGIGGIDLHHADRGRRGRAADHRGVQCGRGAQGHGRAAGRRWWRPLLGRYRQGAGRRRACRDDGRHVLGHRRGAGRGVPVPGPLVQELPWHGFGGRDEGWRGRPLLPEDNTANVDKLVPEGIEGRVPYKGSVMAIIHQLCGGVRASMGYCGSQSIADWHETSQFVQITAAGMRESHVHDVQITRKHRTTTSTERPAARRPATARAGPAGARRRTARHPRPSGIAVRGRSANPPARKT